MRDSIIERFSIQYYKSSTLAEFDSEHKITIINYKCASANINNYHIKINTKA